MRDHGDTLIVKTLFTRRPEFEYLELTYCYFPYTIQEDTKVAPGPGVA
jgi:hypothetical protein